MHSDRRLLLSISLANIYEIKIEGEFEGARKAIKNRRAHGIVREFRESSFLLDECTLIFSAQLTKLVQSYRIKEKIFIPAFLYQNVSQAFCHIIPQREERYWCGSEYRF